MTIDGRRFLAPVAATIIGTACCLAVAVQPVEACSCAKSDSPCARPRPDMVVFVGTPKSVEAVPGKDAVRISLAVDERFAGETGDRVEVETPDTIGACGVPFQIGTKYLVYANRTSSGLSVSQCSRTGPLESRRDDLALLKETASGHVRARLSGDVIRFNVLLDGFFLHAAPSQGLSDVPITVRGATRTYETRTDKNGQFSVVGMEPGSYTVEPRLPAPYVPFLNQPTTVTLDGCLGEVSILATTIPLRGIARPSNGRPANRDFSVRAARLDADGKITFAQTTLAFSGSDGTWWFPGLPAGRYLIGVNTYDAPSVHSPYPTTWYPSAARPSDATVIVVSDARPQNIEFRLPEPLPAVQIAGRVVDDRGEGLPGAFVMIYDDDDPHAIESWKSSIASETTDQTGHFTATGFAGRRYHAQAGWRTTLDRSPTMSDLVPVIMDPSPAVTLTIKR